MEGAQRWQAYRSVQLCFARTFCAHCALRLRAARDFLMPVVVCTKPSGHVHNRTHSDTRY